MELSRGKVILTAIRKEVLSNENPLVVGRGCPLGQLAWAPAQSPLKAPRTCPGRKEAGAAGLPSQPADPLVSLQPWDAGRGGDAVTCGGLGGPVQPTRRLLAGRFWRAFS